MIDVYGIGPGDPAYLTESFDGLCQGADWIIGSDRQLALVPEVYSHKKRVLPKLSQLLEDLREAMAAGQGVLVLASGDPMLYGIGSYLYDKFPSDRIRIHPGISSMLYIFSRIGLSANDCFFTSCHGRALDVDLITRLPKLALVTDTSMGPYEIASVLVDQGKRESRVYIGENLSYPNERIRVYQAQNVPEENYSMNVVVVVNEG